MEPSLVVTCGACGARNRVPAAKLDATPRCGRCKKPLSPTAVPHELPPGQLDELLAAAPIPVFVDFWAPWCGPCRMVAPEVKKLAERSEGRFLVVKVNTEADPQAAARHGVRSIPLFVTFHRGRKVGQLVGARPVGDLLRLALGDRVA